MPSAIEEGRIPAIRVFHRAWYDEHVAANIIMEPPKKVTRQGYFKIFPNHYFQRPFTGQTFCVRVMFTEFRVDASNIFLFEGAGKSNLSADYSLEWGIFKPAADNQQVWLYTIFGTSGRRSSRLVFGRSTSNDVSGHYKRYYFLFFFLFFLRRLLFS